VIDFETRETSDPRESITNAKDVMPFDEMASEAGAEATQYREGRPENYHSPESGIPVEVFRLLAGMQGIHAGRNEIHEN
jgi:hypothetical protein